jgi:predicted phosphodiesterase
MRSSCGTVALISDVHANLQALEAVLADIDRRGIREVWNAGDVVGYGGSPGEVIEILRRRRVRGVAGNLDRKLFRVAGPEARRKPGPVSLKRLTHHWTWGRLDAADRRYLRDLPFSRRFRRCGWTVLLVHGSPDSDEEYLQEGIGRRRLRELSRKARARIVVAGHSHVPFAARASGTRFVNAGSVGRLEGKPGRAAYAILTLAPGRMRVHPVEVPYDVAGAARAIRRTGLPEAYARMVLTGRKLARVVKGR